MKRVFLLSPANTSGERGRLLLRENAASELALRLQQGTATISEVYTFISSLYFRGKVAYSRAFALPPEGVEPAMVITPGEGLLPLDTPLSRDRLHTMAGVPIDEENAVFRDALTRDAITLRDNSCVGCEYVLLGSIASEKYVTPLVEVFGERLVFPGDFVGRGDMSRGGLMLRAAESGIALSYIAVKGAVRRGQRPARLPKKTR